MKNLYKNVYTWAYDFSTPTSKYHKVLIGDATTFNHDNTKWPKQDKTLNNAHVCNLPLKPKMVPHQSNNKPTYKYKTNTTNDKYIKIQQYR